MIDEPSNNLKPDEGGDLLQRVTFIRCVTPLLIASNQSISAVMNDKNVHFNDMVVPQLPPSSSEVASNRSKKLIALSYGGLIVFLNVNSRRSVLATNHPVTLIAAGPKPIELAGSVENEGTL